MMNINDTEVGCAAAMIAIDSECREENNASLCSVG